MLTLEVWVVRGVIPTHAGTTVVTARRSLLLGLSSRRSNSRSLGRQRLRSGLLSRFLSTLSRVATRSVRVVDGLLLKETFKYECGSKQRSVASTHSLGLSRVDIG
jgi:hypothetical protein